MPIVLMPPSVPGTPLPGRSSDPLRSRITSPHRTCIVSYSVSRRRASASSSRSGFRGIRKSPRRRQRLRRICGDRVAADVLEAVAGGLDEAEEQKRAVGRGLALTVPLRQNLGGFLGLGVPCCRAAATRSSTK